LFIWQVKNKLIIQVLAESFVIRQDVIIYLQKQAIVNNMGKKCAVLKTLCLAGWPDFGYL
jgi:hypothetical protein